MEKGFTIGGKIRLLVGTLLVFTALVGVGYHTLVGKVRDVGIAKTAEVMLEGHQRELKNLVDSMAATLGRAIAEAPDEQARQQIIGQLLDKVRFEEDGSGYFFVYTRAGVVVTVPPKPELRGKDLSGNVDKKGNHFIRDLIAAAGRGGDFVRYYFDKPGQGVQPKLAYAKTIPGTDYWVGTGVYIDNVEQNELANRAEINALSGKFVTWLIAGVVLLLALVLPLSWLLVRSIVKPVKGIEEFARQVSAGNLGTRLSGRFDGELRQLKVSIEQMAERLRQRAQLAEAIAEGDLTGEVELTSEQDQFGKALAKMTRRLNELMGQIQISGEQIASGAMQVSDSSQSLSQGATESASSLEQISSSLTEITSQTRLSAENAGQARQLTLQVREAANQGNLRMRTMVSAMGEINEASQNISRIIKTIDEIAFQTNLLALNAAVEAARAGQHGKGFAVVAEEVRNLAARSATAARETAELIQNSVEKTTRGSDIARQTEEAFGTIVGGIGQASALVEEIAAAANEQAQGLAQINIGLGQIDQVTQQNTANAEESAAAAEELSSQAARLRDMLGRFRIKGRQGAANSRALSYQPDDWG
ncbi:methyl-accepting chemotaxis protein [Desulfuromonas versatilis]|uniref:Methyl-accepting chemotaxis protein n=1 Tax=Desulfuromonas versatilis TaxID=2802975 RepID=A0ABM8HZW3_9BACT|nr:methyl-accepting chemotaxis protein [Desulfuromonas versatilis]BCR06375.1 methyl-accepting chemotaxis protein [Desulfuromonas versatilis]